MEKLGRGTIKFTNPPKIISHACIVGKKEGEGPMGELFDRIEPDEYFGQDNWEQAESQFQSAAIDLCLEKCGVKNSDLDAAVGGDLLNQCTATSFAVKQLDAPFLGVYGACSTIAESLISASLLVDGGYGDYVLASAGSHFCSAEKQFRTPLEYGSQRPPSAQWTVTGAGAVLLGGTGKVSITAATVGTIVDRGITDANHMGGAMAPAFAHTITAHLRNSGAKPSDYDAVFSGDLGVIGMDITRELLRQEGINLSDNYHDCGEMIFDREKQDVHAGGSGCGCAASVLCAYILPKLESGEWKRVLFTATGALLSPTTVLQGESIPCIAHAVELRSENK
ncbi:MAG: stage V sporulation protein AD [Clostridia bacterium]